MAQAVTQRLHSSYPREPVGRRSKALGAVRLDELHGPAEGLMESFHQEGWQLQQTMQSCTSILSSLVSTCMLVVDAGS